MFAIKCIRSCYTVEKNICLLANHTHINRISSSAIIKSRYGPHFQEPIYRINELDELAKNGGQLEYEHASVKAATKDATCSVFHDETLRKFTKYVMRTGRIHLARSLMDETFKMIKITQLKKYNETEIEEERKLIECDPIIILNRAVNNCRPLFTMRPIAKGGIRYQVPFPVTEKKEFFMACKWLVEAGRTHERTIHFPQNMAKELLLAAYNEGSAVAKKQELHKRCEANRAYVHYRF